MEISLDTYIVSDTHWLHKNIIKYCNRPMHHDRLMEKNWHEIVGPQDEVLHLGDLMVWFNQVLINEASEIASRLPGKKYLIRGNHDKLKTAQLAKIGFTEVPEFIQTFGQTRILFSHYPDTERIGTWDLNVHGHIHNNDHHSDLDTRSHKYINVSIEMMDYKPVKLRDIIV